jgi:hypothetical protein
MWVLAVKSTWNSIVAKSNGSVRCTLTWPGCILRVRLWPLKSDPTNTLMNSGICEPAGEPAR